MIVTGPRTSSLIGSATLCSVFLNIGSKAPVQTLAWCGASVLWKVLVLVIPTNCHLFARQAVEVAADAHEAVSPSAPFLGRRDSKHELRLAGLPRERSAKHRAEGAAHQAYVATLCPGVDAPTRPARRHDQHDDRQRSDQAQYDGAEIVGLQAMLSRW